MKIQYDETVTVSYGAYHCPECNAGFYGGGEALHKQGCADTSKGYENCIKLLGDKAIESIKASAQSLGEDWTGLSDVSLRMLREQLPEIASKSS